MRHFIAYHSPIRMGFQYPIAKNNYERFLTNKSVQRALGGTVWVVTFKAKYNYVLASVFQVDDIGVTSEKGFNHQVFGRGHPFEPWREIKHLEWFPTLMRVTGRFGFGFREVSERSVIMGLIDIAEEDGYRVDMP